MVTQHIILQAIHSGTCVMVSGSFSSCPAFPPHSLAGGFRIQLVLAPLLLEPKACEAGPPGRKYVAFAFRSLLLSGGELQGGKQRGKQAHAELGSGDDALPKISPGDQCGPSRAGTGSREKGIHLAE